MSRSTDVCGNGKRKSGGGGFHPSSPAEIGLNYFSQQSIEGQTLSGVSARQQPNAFLRTSQVPTTQKTEKVLGINFKDLRLYSF